MMKRIYQLINEAQRKAEKTYKAPDEAPESVASGNGDNAIQQGNGTPLVYGKSVLPKPEKLAECGLRSAPCLSGGGVRSATFNLGILQGLARHGLLDKFDYLSTVSGGGFIGRLAFCVGTARGAGERLQRILLEGEPLGGR